jgi:hypothetical protein
MARKVRRCGQALLSLLVLAGCGPREISPEARSVLTQWLAQDCDSGERGRLKEELRKFGTVLEEPLISAFEKGPPPAELARAENTARQQFDYTRRAIEAGRLHGLSPELIATIRSEPIAERLKRVRENAVDGYRSAALAGLAAIGGRKGRQLLEKHAADPRSQYRDAALPLLGREAELKSNR